jgi:hypothetical protein
MIALLKIGECFKNSNIRNDVNIKSISIQYNHKTYANIIQATLKI